jgi:methylmalonyl-CoA epimerase
MKKSIFIILIASFFILGFSLGKKNTEALITNKKMMQVGIIVKDIEKSAANWADLLGLEKSPEIKMAAVSESVPTEYKGKPSEATAKLAFLKLENITIELIEPVGEHSTWKEFLDTKGEGIHHIAFNVKGMDGYIEKFENRGIPMIQRGGWATGEYTYMDGSNNLGLIIELLEQYNQ